MWFFLVSNEYQNRSQQFLNLLYIYIYTGFVSFVLTGFFLLGKINTALILHNFV